jgi:hypothetical protein
VTEAEWLASTDPDKMLEFIREGANDHKLRLFAVACCRRIYDLLEDVGLQRSVEVAERFAVGSANWREVVQAKQSAEGAIVRRVACGYARTAVDFTTSPIFRTLVFDARDFPVRGGDRSFSPRHDCTLRLCRRGV